MTATRLPAAQRRAQLLDVGREVFADRGLDGASMEQIALRAGVSKPVVYEHFRDKEGLYAAVVELELELLLTSFSGALRGASPRLLLEQATLALLTYVQDREDGFRILVRESPAAGSFITLMSDVATKVEHLLAQQFIGRGLDTTYVGLYSQALVGQVALVGQWWHDHRDHAPIEEVAAHLVNLAWNGLAHLHPEPGLLRS